MTIAQRMASGILGALLRLYPKSFREEFGAAVRDLIDRELAAAATRGPLAVMHVLAAHTIDVILSSLRLRIAPWLPTRGDGWRGAWNAWQRDAKYGTRILAKQRGFSAVVIVTLALAIGANTVIFSFTNILLLRSLPVRDSETLGWIFNVNAQTGGDRQRSSVADFLDMRQSARSFSALTARTLTTMTLSESGRDAERVDVNRVTANLFDVWGLRMAVGRGFPTGADAPGASPLAVVSDQFWQRHFAGNRAIVGTTMMLDGVSHTIVGILAPDIEIGNLSTIDVWTPLTLAPGTKRDERRVAINGRLAPGVTHAQASAEIAAIAKRLQQDHPRTNAGWDARVTETRDAMAGVNTWMVLALLSLVVAFVLLIACANLANLMLARSSERAREIAVRTALGASRGAIVRQLVLESLLLGVIGGAFGLALAHGGFVVLKAFAHEEIFDMLAIDRNVLAFAAAITMVTSVAFSLAPAIQASRADIAELLKSGSGKTTRRSRRGRSVLVVSQVALAMSLTIVATLIVRSLAAEVDVDLGFDARTVFSFRVDAPTLRYPGDEDLRHLYSKTLTAVTSLRGVRAAGLTNRIPVLDGESSTAVHIEGRDAARPADQPWASVSSVSNGFFDAAGISLIAGRGLDARDDVQQPGVAIVNREMARRHWSSPAAALGKRVAIGSDEPREWVTIVGVASDTKGIDATLPTSPQIYVPMVQRPTRAIAVVVRADSAVLLQPEVRAVMRQLDAGLAVYDARTVQEGLDIERSSGYTLTGMFTAFAIIALSLAAAGLYGVISYSVSQRTREIGIRVALGATTGEVRRLVLAQGGRLLAIGAVVGVLMGALIAKGIQSLLYSVSPLDPVSYGTVLGLIVVVMGIALYAPARRATSVDPNEALRAE